MDTQQQNTSSERGFNELNGVNLDKMNETINAIKENASLAEFKFRCNNEWITGGDNRIDVKPFYGCGEEYKERDPRFTLESDPPEVLLGTDKGADPVEYVLVALSSCITTTLSYHGAARGIAIHNMSSTYEGDLDLQGFLGLSDKVRKGYSDIRIKFNVETDASEADLRELVKFSPVYEMISAGVPVHIDFNITKPKLS